MSGPPPPYEEQSSHLYGQPARDSQDGNAFIPEDFKYSTVVISFEPIIRQRFMHKVYSLLSCQLLASLSFCYWASVSTSLQNFIMSHIALFYICMVVSLVSCIWLAVSPRPEDYEASVPEPLLTGSSEEPAQEQRRLPWYVLSSYKQKLTLLSIFTLSEAYCLSLVTLAYDKDTVLSALLITTIVVVGVSLTALSERFENVLNSATSIYYWLNWGLWIMIGMGLTALLFGWNTHSSKFNLLYGWLGAILFTAYLFIDTQLIFRKVYPDEEVRCAMMLYLDIVNLFLSILRILANSNDDN